MANEKRLIDANEIYELFYKQVEWGATDLMDAFDDALQDAQTVDAVEIQKYEALVGMYHELRENFVDYVCSGVRNEAPYCLNKCKECVDKRGWCKLERCQGFNPAEVILDRYAKMDGDDQ